MSKEKTYKLAKEVFEMNPTFNEVFVCDDGNVFEHESRALAHCRENKVKFLGGVRRGEIKTPEQLKAEKEAAEKAKAEQEAAEKEAAEKAKAEQEAAEKEAAEKAQAEQEAAEKEAAEKAQAEQEAAEKEAESPKEEAPVKKKKSK